MCGRFVLTADGKIIQQQFDLDTAPVETIARYNIAPSQPVLAIPNDDPKNTTFFRWGLIPSWAKDPKIGYKMINARSETAHEKPSFRAAFKRRRCLIPTNGFYEWSKRGSSKTPMFIHMEDQDLFALAGLWETWQGPDGGEIRTCTILTTEPNEVVRPLHNRMPVILHAEDYKLWLEPGEVPAPELMPLMRPYEPDHMSAYEVSKVVNSPLNDTPECIAPVPGQSGLL